MHQFSAEARTSPSPRIIGFLAALDRNAQNSIVGLRISSPESTLAGRISPFCEGSFPSPRS